VSLGVARSVRDRLVDAAFELFDERGYEQTTIEDIVERAGVGRTTFFRNYRSKEDVIFPDHDLLMEQIRQRLATSNDSTALIAVSEAVRLVLLRYLDEGDRARQRYRLTSRVPALRDRENASVARYQRLFREFITGWSGPHEKSALSAELMAASVVAAHNHVLRRWLRGETDDPLAEVDLAMTEVTALFTPTPASERAADEYSSDVTVVVIRGDRKPDDILAAVRAALRLT
jgi:AcrR family transcriptional regulator